MEPPSPGFAALRTFVVDCAYVLPVLERGVTSDGRPHDGAHCLVLDRGRPIGTIEIPFERDADKIEADLLAAKIAEELPCCTHAEVDEPARPVRLALGASVVIATRDRPEQLVACVESILNGSVRPRQLIVVDNAPTDERTRHVVAELSRVAPFVEYLREDRPGLAVAHNAALPYVTSPVVAFTDDDVLVGREWLERISAGFDDADVACVTGMIAPLELETLPQLLIESSTGFNKGYATRSFHRDEPTDDPLFPYSAGVFGSGANMAFRTEYLRSNGGFDEALGAGTEALGGDDLAAFFDVIDAGHRLVYEPSAFVRHRHHREHDALTRQAYGYGCGLTAYLTRCVTRDPLAALRFARLAARGLRRARSIATPPATVDLPPYPRALSRRQWLGMLVGPARYLRSRRALQASQSQEPVVAPQEETIAA